MRPLVSTTQLDVCLQQPEVFCSGERTAAVNVPNIRAMVTALLTLFLHSMTSMLSLLNDDEGEQKRTDREDRRASFWIARCRNVSFSVTGVNLLCN